MMLTGCSNKPTDAQAPAADQLQTIKPLPPGSLEVPTSIAGDPDRALDDMGRAIRRLDWAVIASHTYDETDLDAQMSASHLHVVTALLPDGREAEVHLYIEDDVIGVQARVGRLGDEALETKLIETFMDVLAGPPMKKRDKTFELPEGMFIPSRQE